MVSQAGDTLFAYNAVGFIARMRWRDYSATYFCYDGNLQRYAIRENGTLSYYIWDGLDILQERNADGTLKEEHTHAKTPIAGIGQLTESYRPGEAAANQRIYPIMDQRGTIFKYVKADGMTILASREYDAFGRVIDSGGTWLGRFGFQGQAWLEIFSTDGSQRLLFSPTRLYDPNDGRFLQNEPLVRARSLDHYTYAIMDMVSTVDPLGLQDVPQKECCCCLIAVLQYDPNSIYGKGGETPHTVEVNGQTVRVRVESNEGLMKSGEKLRDNPEYQKECPQNLGPIGVDDVLGSGESVLPEGGVPSFKGLVDRINAAMKEKPECKGLSRITIIGHGGGGELLWPTKQGENKGEYVEFEFKVGTSMPTSGLAEALYKASRGQIQQITLSTCESDALAKQLADTLGRYSQQLVTVIGVKDLGVTSVGKNPIAPYMQNPVAFTSYPWVATVPKVGTR